MSAHKKILAAVASIRNQIREIELLAEPPHMKGYQFEKDFLAECRSRGLDAGKASGGGHVDLVVAGRRVQCKHVTPNDAGDVFIQPGQRSYYLPTDFDVLAMKSDESLYIIPMQSLPMTNGHVRIQVRPVSLTMWIDAWGVFTGDGVPQPRTLFDM